MDIREFEAFVPGVLERMRADGYSAGTVGTAEWVYGLFADYCKKEGVEQIWDPPRRAAGRGGPLAAGRLHTQFPPGLPRRPERPVRDRARPA